VHSTPQSAVKAQSLRNKCTADSKKASHKTSHGKRPHTAQATRNEKGHNGEARDRYSLSIY
jgi:hypothetical protein